MTASRTGLLTAADIRTIPTITVARATEGIEKGLFGQPIDVEGVRGVRLVDFLRYWTATNTPVEVRGRGDQG